MKAIWGRGTAPTFLTSAEDGREWSASRSGRALSPGKGSPVHMVLKAGWVPQRVWMQRLEKNLLPLSGIESSWSRH
jgi:hypothetical protein